MKRRQFTEILGLLTGALAASAYGGAPAISKLMPATDVAGFSRCLLGASIGSTFQLPDEQQSIVLKGIEDATFNNPCEQFHLIFELESESRLEEGIHTLVSQDGSRMELYLVPSELVTERPQVVSSFSLLPAV